MAITTKKIGNKEHEWDTDLGGPLIRVPEQKKSEAELEAQGLIKAANHKDVPLDAFADSEPDAPSAPAKAKARPRKKSAIAPEDPAADSPSAAPSVETPAS